MPRWIAVDDWDTNKDGRISLGELVKGTAGIFLTCLGAMFFGCVSVMAMRHEEIGDVGKFLFGWWFWFSLFVSIIVTTGVSLWRLIGPERAERIDKKERDRRWVREDFEDSLKMNMATQVPGESTTQVDIDQAVRLMLAHYFKHGTFARGKVDNVSDRHWNEANELLKSCRLRRGRKMEIEAEDFAEAWGKYIDWRVKRTQWRVKDGELFVK